MIRIGVKFFGPFRDLFGGREREINLPAEVRLVQLLDSLCDTPARQEQVFPGSPAAQSHVIIMKNGVPLHGRERLDALLNDGDVIAIFPFLGGG